MRLIKVSSVIGDGPLVLENIPADDIPNHPYAILSHTWGLDEVVFTDIANDTARAKPAFAKVAFTCRQAARDGLEYAWIDSCCIDKASSAELSEAINSMFPWYRAAACCYALLEDYHHETLVPSALSRCRWFTRGWTLQELLGPSTVTFHAASGTCIGTRESLCRHIADITRIDADILTGELPLGAASVAKRMSWAANRQTTRLEDTAYCLLGIFDVNMPMLYGEGAHAFVRLQEEIMKTTDDESLFAWCDVDADPTVRHGLLAGAPRFFAASAMFIPYQDWESRPPFQMTNRGLQISLPIAPTGPNAGTYLAALNCPAPPDFRNRNFLAVYLEKIAGGGNHYARVRAGEFARVGAIQGRETIHVRQNFGPSIAEDMRVFPQHAIQLRGGPDMLTYPSVMVVAPTDPDGHPRPLMNEHFPAPRQPFGWRSSSQWRPEKGTGEVNAAAFMLPRAPGRAACGVVVMRSNGKGVLVVLGSAKLFSAGFCAVELPRGVGEVEPDELQPLFVNPEPLGTEVELEENAVRVEATSMVLGSCKYLLVDIRMEPLGSETEEVEVLPEKKKASRWRNIISSSRVR